MDSNVDISDAAENPLRLRSLDLESLYVENPRIYGGDCGFANGNFGLNRENGSFKKNRKSVSRRAKNEAVGLGRFKKRKARREVSLSSLEPLLKKSKKCVDSSSLNPNSKSNSKSNSKTVDGTGLNSTGLNTIKAGSGLNSNQIVKKKHKKKKVSGVVSVGNSQVENVTATSVKAGSFSNHKFQSNAQAVKDCSNRAVNPVGASCSGTAPNVISSIQSHKCSKNNLTCLIGNMSSRVRSSVGKEKKIPYQDDEKNLVGKEKKISNELKVVFSDKPSLVRFNCIFSHKKTRSNCRKKWKSVTEALIDVSDEPLVKSSVTVYRDSTRIGCLSIPSSQEYDQENLEHNAARMLSSRFNPSCNSSGEDATNSILKSASGSSILMPFHHDSKSLGSNSSLGLEFFSADVAGRVLRPRIHKQNGTIKKRRRFVEICSTNLDGHWVLNRRIKVFWTLDESWYFGLVEKYDPEAELHCIKYDDRDEEWISLRTERFKLLLFPGEVPCQPRSSCAEPCSERKHRGENGDAKGGASMESEPIISWLTRANLRVHSSPLGSLKTQKRPRLSMETVPPILSEASEGSPKDKSVFATVNRDGDVLFVGSLVYERAIEGERHVIREVHTCSTSFDNGRTLYVYHRRQFQGRGQGFGNREGENCSTGTGLGYTSFFASVLCMIEAEKESIVGTSEAIVLNANVNKLLTLVKPDGSKDFGSSAIAHNVEDLTCGDTGLDEPFGGFEQIGCKSCLLSVEITELSKSAVSSVELEQVKLNLNLPRLWVFNFTSRVDRFWVYSALLLLHYGTLFVVWPNVYLEILFVDNIAGLRFLLFDGYLGQAVAFLCLILTTFKQSIGHREIVGGQLPVTSIRFKISGSQDLGRQLVLVFYNFSEITTSRWNGLDITLKRHCSIAKELPLGECTHDNIKILQSRRDRIPGGLESSYRSCKEGFTDRHISKTLSCVNMSCPSHTSIESHGKLPPFLLSFAAAPNFFLHLHLKLLMESSKIACNSFENCDLFSSQKNPKNYDRMASDVICSLVEDSLDHVREAGPKHMECSLRLDNCADSGYFSCSHTKVETGILPLRNDSDWIKSSRQSLNCKLNVNGTSVGLQELEKNHGDDSFHGNIIRIRRCPCHTGSRRYAGRSQSEVLDFPEKPESGCVSSCLNNAVRSPFATRTPQNSVLELGWNMHSVCGQNPTAPRSIWHRNRFRSVSPSFAYRSKLWSDGRMDSIQNGLVNSCRKPRTEMSGSLSFTRYEFDLKPRTHHQKARPLKWIKSEKASKVSVCRSPRRYLEALSCDANVLVTEGDRGWRECGAQVVLESLNRDDWILLVKFSGCTKYSHKGQQIMQPGTANRYTHAMMWKGGKDWSLEFCARSQWILFKEMHDECYNRNIQAASVKSIPIPGVRLVKDAYSDDVDVPFVRGALKYFCQVGTEVDMAMDPSHVMYDMESDDEELVCKLRDSLNISDETFEKAMDMFEKVAYAQHRDDFTSDEMLQFVVGVGSSEVVKTIFEHWRQKRQRKGMPLIRQFLPPLWELYQQQVKEWELATSKVHNFSNGCKEKVGMVEKPPVFAFCLRPRGLEVLNKGSKQRSQRKFATSAHNNAFSRDYENFQVSGRKLNGCILGEENGLVSVQDSESSDFLPLHHYKISPRGATCSRTLPMVNDASERNQNPELHRNKSKMELYMSSCDFPKVAMPIQRPTGKSNRVLHRWKMGLPEWPSTKQNQSDGFLGYCGNQSSGSDYDEFRLRDAESVAKLASDLAKFKREKARRLLQKADLVIHKAVVALMTAEAMKASEEDSGGGE